MASSRLNLRKSQCGGRAKKLIGLKWQVKITNCQYGQLDWEKDESFGRANLKKHWSEIIQPLTKKAWLKNLIRLQKIVIDVEIDPQ